MVCYVKFVIFFCDFGEVFFVFIVCFFRKNLVIMGKLLICLNCCDFFMGKLRRRKVGKSKSLEDGGGCVKVLELKRGGVLKKNLF